MDFGVSGRAVSGRLPAIKIAAASSSSSSSCSRDHFDLSETNVLLSALQLKHSSLLRGTVYTDMDDSIDLISPIKQQQQQQQSLSDSQTDPQSADPPPIRSIRPRKPKTMQRAKHWSNDVENLFRFQQAGYRDEEEYREMHGNPPEYWESTKYVKCLQTKQSCFMYFRQSRECDDKYLNKIKLYQY